MAPKTVEKLDRVVVRFAGDSGDGMQLTGSRFTDATAVVGNDLATLPDFPAEIRAPAGTPHGVSAFQIHFASRDILTPGDHPNVLVAMNPAALITNVGTLEKGGTVIVNEDGFTDHNVRKAGYESNPLEDGSLDDYQIFRVPMTSMTVRATEGIDGISARDAARCKNVFALGLVSWMYGRPTEPTVAWIEKKFADMPAVGAANLAAFRAGYNFGETAELLAVHYEVDAAPAPPGTYRNVNGTQALAYGLVAAAVQSGLGLFYASYPITPASELLHSLSRHHRLGVRTIQAEDEIAAVNMALGAAFSGHLGVTATSGPGMDLKAETIGLAVAYELPLVVVDVQRAGPSTGHADQDRGGRPDDGAVRAPRRVAAAGDRGIDAVGLLRLRHRGGAHRDHPSHAGDPAQRHVPRELVGAVEAAGRGVAAGHRPELRDRPARASCRTRATPTWRVPGPCPAPRACATASAGSRRRTAPGTSPTRSANHEHMTHLRAERIARVSVPDIEVDDPDGASLLVLGWGSSYGAIQGAARRLRREQGLRVATAHIRHLNPLPANTGEVLRAYERVLVPEMNMGQLVKILRAEFLVDCESFTKVDGLPIFTRDMMEVIAPRC